MKKIGVLIDELFQGGFQKVAIMEVIYLQKQGFKTDLVVLRRTQELGYRDLIKEHNLNVVFLSDRLPKILKINFKIPFFSFFSFFHIFYPFFIYNYVVKNEYDFFITHGTYTALSSISIKIHRNIPFIGYIHDSISYILVQKYKGRFLEKLSFLTIPIGKLLDNCIVSEAEKIIAFPFMIEELKKNFKDEDKFIPIYNGCEIKESKNIIDRKPYIIAVTKWDRGKNFNLLVKLYKRNPDLPLIKIVGEYHPENILEEFTKAVEENNVSERFVFLGRVTESNLSRFYSEALLLIHPCREAFGMTILEAASFGCPSVFSKNSGVADLFTEKVTRNLPEENNIEDYEKEIKRIFKLNKEEYENLSNVYFETARKNDWNKHCSKIAEIILRKN